MAKSLLDGIEDQPKSKAKKKSGGGSNTDPKLFVALGLFVLAIGILVYWYVIRDPGGAHPEFDPAQVQQALEAQQAEQKRVEQAGATTGGS